MTELPSYRIDRHAPLLRWPPARPERGVLAALARAFGRWRRREHAIAELAALDDRTLADIGLHRSEIRSAVIDTDGAGAPYERRRCR